MPHIDLVLGWEPLLKADRSSLSVLLALCHVFGVRTHWDEPGATLYIEPPLSGKNVALLPGQNTSPEEFARIGVDLCRRLIRAGACVLPGRRAGSDAIIYIHPTPLPHVSVGGPSPWVRWYRTRKLARILTQEVERATEISGPGATAAVLYTGIARFWASPAVAAMHRRMSDLPTEWIHQGVIDLVSGTHDPSRTPAPELLPQASAQSTDLNRPAPGRGPAPGALLLDPTVRPPSPKPIVESPAPHPNPAETVDSPGTDQRSARLLSQGPASPLLYRQTDVVPPTPPDRPPSRFALAEHTAAPDALPTVTTPRRASQSTPSTFALRTVARPPGGWHQLRMAPRLTPRAASTEQEDPPTGPWLSTPDVLETEPTYERNTPNGPDDPDDPGDAEVTEVTEAAEVAEVPGVAETTELAEITEVNELVGVTDLPTVTDLTEVTEPPDATEPIEPRPEAQATMPDQRTRAIARPAARVILVDGAVIRHPLSTHGS